MARYLEEKIDDMEAEIAAMRAQHDRTLPTEIDARLLRLEEIVEAVFGFVGRSLQREDADIKRELAGIAARKRAAKLGRSLKKAKPVKR